jgi:uncharacterized membrane protein YozB (DUF420 family)
VDPATLPTLNAALNAVAASLLIAGFLNIRRGRVAAHRRSMLAAFAVSSLFLVLYVAHKVLLGFESTTFQAEGAARVLYRILLVSHVLLAMAVPVLAIAMIRLGLTRRIETHRKLARLAWPVWMYVSATGVIIYVLLYHLNPTAE